MHGYGKTEMNFVLSSIYIARLVGRVGEGRGRSRGFYNFFYDKFASPHLLGHIESCLNFIF
jgi:hypothetical protein